MRRFFQLPKQKGMILVGLYALCCLWFYFQVIKSSIDYARHGTEVSGKVLSLEISQDYQLIAKVSYEMDSQKYIKMMPISPCYPNQYAAELSLKRFENSFLPLWVSEKNPSDCVSQKQFPYKQIFYCFLIQAIGCYFLFIKTKVYSAEKFTFGLARKPRD